MSDRDTLIQDFLAAQGWPTDQLTILAGDASNRRYWRVQRPCDGAVAVLMDAPPEKQEDVREELLGPTKNAAYDGCARQPWHVSILRKQIQWPFSHTHCLNSSTRSANSLELAHAALSGLRTFCLKTLC